MNSKINWEYKTLAEICETITDFVANGSFASLKENVKYKTTKDYAVLIRLSDFNRSFDESGRTYIDERGYNFLKKSSLVPDQLIISNVGEYSGTVFKAPNLSMPMTLGPNAITIKTKYCDEFYYYWFSGYEGKNALLNIRSGSAVPKFNKTEFKTVLAPCPPLETQKKIAGILKSLNDKIETNQKIISNLEKTAQLLFKHWFIDFEFPDENGKPYKSSGGEMVESELGLIPKRWTTKPIDQCADFLNGLALQKFPSTGGVYLPAIKIKELHEGVTTSSDKVSVDLPSNYMVNDGDLLFSWSGSLEVVLWTGGRGALNQHLFKVTSGKYPQWFIYSWLLHFLPNFRETAKNKATTMGHIQRKHLSESIVVVPNEKYLKLSDQLFQPIIESIISRQVENRQLVKVRDLLLPKLISGEVEV